MSTVPETHGLKIEDVVGLMARYIEQNIFGERQVRVRYSEKSSSSEFGPRLVTAYTTLPNDSGRVHNYPLSIAGWALAEGRIIAWPEERDVPCDFSCIELSGKFEDLSRLVLNDRLINAPPYLARTIDVDVLKRKFQEKSLKLGDFYQDWSSWSPVSRYSQFISVPVPIWRQSGRVPEGQEFGVFNIDAFDTSPLLSQGIQSALIEVSGKVEQAYQRL